MNVVEITSLKEAAKVLPMLGVLSVALAVNQGETVEVFDEQKGIKYIFKPKERQVNCNESISN